MPVDNDDKSDEQPSNRTPEDDQRKEWRDEDMGVNDNLNKGE